MNLNYVLRRIVGPSFLHATDLTRASELQRRVDYLVAIANSTNPNNLRKCRKRAIVQFIEAPISENADRARVEISADSQATRTLYKANKRALRVFLTGEVAAFTTSVLGKALDAARAELKRLKEEESKRVQELLGERLNGSHQIIVTYSLVVKLLGDTIAAQQFQPMQPRQLVELFGGEL